MNLRRLAISSLPPAAAAAVVAGLAGCSAAYDQNFFDYDREQSRTRRLFEAQYAAAAVQEATLRPSHFDEAEDDGGPRLTALGRERLDHIVKARRPGEAITVCVDAPEADADEANAMVAAAERYLAAMSLPEGAMTVMAAPAETAPPAADVMADVREFNDAGAPSGGAAEDGGAGDPTAGIFGSME